MRQISTNPFCVSLGTVQEVAGYFSTLGEECAVVIKEHREHGLVYEFLNYFTAAFSSSLPLNQHRNQHRYHPWRTWQYSTHLEKAEVWRRPKSSGLVTWFFPRPVFQLLYLTGMDDGGRCVQMWSLCFMLFYCSTRTSYCFNCASIENC